MEDYGFTFNGRHCDEFGTAYIVSKWPGAAPVTPNTASVSGRDGTIRYDGQTYEEKSTSGTIYILDENDELMSYTDMMSRADEIVAWLQPGGRKQLILDAIPERFYMAEILHEIQFETDEWENGAASLAFTLQPFSYAINPDTVAYTLAAGVAQAKTLALPGDMPAPVTATITAAAAVTWVQVAIGGAVMRLEGMSLASGDVVTIDADIAKAETVTVSINGVASRGYMTAASACPFTAQPGNNTVTLSASGACSVSVSARGRWKK